MSKNNNLSLNKLDILLDDNTQYGALSESERRVMSKLLENTAQEASNSFAYNVNEDTAASDIATFTPILLPLVRRTVPNLIANQLLGVQPMLMPTGYLYALVNTYSGDDSSLRIDPNNKAVILKLDKEPTGLTVGNTFNTDWKCIHKEGLYVLALKGNTPLNVNDTEVDSSVTAKAVAIYSNEAAFGNILQNYTGPYTTAAGEKLGKDMKEVGFTVTKKAIEAKTRALKGKWTVEMYQDLQAQHGLYADAELTNLMSYEIQAEIDREVVNFINANATQLPDTKFTQTNAQIPTGRWELERYRAEVVRMSKEAAMVGIETKRSNANILLCSPKVCTMLEQVGGFKLAPSATNVGQPIGGVAGLFDNKYTVVVDQYASSDYATMLYKGTSANDAMGFYAPYVPISFTKVTDQDSGQPGVICKTRYALTTTPGVTDPNSNDRAKTYARSWGIDFTNTILA